MYPADELPSHAFKTELVGDNRVDRRHETGRLLHQQITGRALLHIEILVRQHMRLAVHRHGQLLSRLECAQLIRCEGGDGVGGERRVLPEAFAERAIVGLRAQGDERVLGGREVDALHIELGREDRHELPEEPLVHGRRNADGATQRLPHFDFAIFASGTAQCRQLPHGLHRRLERGIARRLHQSFERREVHRLATGELAMQPVGQERRDRREQPTGHDQDFVQRRECGAIVGALDVVEAVATPSHIPVRDFVVDERHERARRGGGVVALEEVVDLVLDRGETRQHPAIEQRPALPRRIVA